MASILTSGFAPLGVRRALATALLLGLFGCGSNPVQDALSLEVDQTSVPLQLSTLCADSTCAVDQELKVAVVYNEGLPKTETAELDQYRVDYALDDVKKTMPFFAAPKKLTLVPGQRADLSLQVTGSAQRSFLIQAIGHGTTTGVATLTFAGYDKDNAQIFIKTTFELRYGEIAVGGASSTPPKTASGDAGTKATSDASVSDAGTY